VKTKEVIWEERRKYFINRLIKEKNEGRVDEDMIELLNTINSLENYYTLSSCSGRVQFLEGKNIGKRKEIKNIGKFHFNISLEDFNKILNEKREYVWILLQPPILHVACKTLEDALKLLNIAKKCGFKHSGIFSKNIDRYVLELNSSVRIEFPIIYEGKLMIDIKNLDTLVNLINENLLKIKNSIKLLKEEIDKNFKK